MWIFRRDRQDEWISQSSAAKQMIVEVTSLPGNTSTRLELSLLSSSRTRLVEVYLTGIAEPMIILMEYSRPLTL